MLLDNKATKQEQDSDKAKIWHICCYDAGMCSHDAALCGHRFKGNGTIKHVNGISPDDCVVCVSLWDSGVRI